ncbi:MAG: hypothetical protein IT285_05655 [Bdellovibrionales bacterium]|nr:hypothetical protein [Bdellovibrionales bacterium]
MSRLFTILLLVGLAGVGLPGYAGSGTPDRSKWLIEFIDPTNFLDWADGHTTLSPSPSPVAGEMARALQRFADPEAAIRRLNEYRQGGRVFAGFRISTSSSSSGALNMLCGRTPSWSDDWEEAFNASVYKTEDAPENPAWTFLESPGSFTNFKHASPREREYAIAQCLSRIPGMPALAPSRPRIEALYIAPDAYDMGVRWLRGRFPAPGSDEQYRHAFRCMITRAGERLDGAGTRIAVRKIKYGEIGVSSAFPHLVAIFRADQEGIERIFEADSDEAPDMEGIWTHRTGWDPNNRRHALEVLFGDELIAEHETRCRLRAGLLAAPPPAIFEPTATRQVRGCGADG